MGNSPIENRIGSVFVPVSNMEHAAAWYSKLLGLSLETTTHGGKIYTLPMAGEVSLILDSHKPVANSSQPLFFFWTPDIKRAYQFFRENEVEIASSIEDIGSVTTLIFKDLDQNLLMVCQKMS